MQLMKFTAASLGVRAGIRFPGKRVRGRSGASSERGQASVEFALLLVFILFPFFVGIITVGVVVNRYLELTDAVGIGARQLAISRAANLTDPCNMAVTTIERAAPFLIPANLTFTFVINGTSYPGVSCSGTNTTAVTNMVSGAAITVTATYPVAFSVWGTKYDTGQTMTAQTTEIIQ
jgi:Flp pilus assembly protein TadG